MSILLNASTSTGLGITSDNSGSIEVQSNGTTKLTVASTGVSGTITAATAQASTSGTFIDFTGIPSWVKKITVILNGVSTTGGSNYVVQLGTSGGIENTGYVSIGGQTYISGVNINTSTTGFLLGLANQAAMAQFGSYTFHNISSNIWIGSGTGGSVPGTHNMLFSLGGSKTLSGTLDRLRITTGNGTDTFDAGSINIFYEG